MSSIKLIVFDLDGVLVEAKNIHFDALNEALTKVNPGYKIGWTFCLQVFVVCRFK